MIPRSEISSPSLIRRWGAVVTIAFCAIHLPSVAKRYEPYTFLERDGSFYFTTLVSVAEHGQLEQRALQPESWYTQPLGWNFRLTEDWSNVSVGRNGGWYPKHPILLPLVTVPVYWLLGPLGALVTNILLNLAFILLIFLVGRRVARPWVAALIAIGIAALPVDVKNSYSFSNDLLTAALAMGALEATLGGWFGWAGALAGFCIWSRLTNAAFVPGLVVIAWDIGGWKAVRRALFSALAPLGILAILNTWEFGAPWTSSYQSVLVREAGKQSVGRHTDAFNVPWKRGFDRLVFSEEGVFKTFPPFAFGLVGLIVLAWKRGVRFASGVLLFCALPCLSVTTYEWYRPHFLYAAVGGSALGLAATVETVIPWRQKQSANAPKATSPLATWQLAAASLLVIAGGLILRRATHPDARYLSSHIHEARVFLDTIPCDYWNPQRERWECSHADPEMWAMTGAVLGDPVQVNHQPRRGIWMHPSPTRKWRRMVFSDLNAKSADLTFALGDETHAGNVQIEIRPRGEPPVMRTLSQAGEELKQHIDIGTGDAPALEIRVRADDPQWKHLVFEGALQN